MYNYVNSPHFPGQQKRLDGLFWKPSDVMARFFSAYLGSLRQHGTSKWAPSGCPAFTLGPTYWFAWHKYFDDSCFYGSLLTSAQAACYCQVFLLRPIPHPIQRCCYPGSWDSTYLHSNVENNLHKHWRRSTSYSVDEDSWYTENGVKS